MANKKKYEHTRNERLGILLDISDSLARVTEPNVDERRRLAILPREWLMHVLVRTAPENTGLRGFIATKAIELAEINRGKLSELNKIPLEQLKPQQLGLRVDYRLAIEGYIAIAEQAQAMNNQQEELASLGDV